MGIEVRGRRSANEIRDAAEVFNDRESCLGPVKLEADRKKLALSAWQAATLRERLRWCTSSSEESDGCGSTIVEQLSQALGGPVALERRLEWSGASLARLRAATAEAGPCPEEAPSWLTTLERIVDGIEPPFLLSATPPRGAEERELAFYPLWSKFTDIAFSEVVTELETGTPELECLLQGLRHDLLTQCSSLGAEVLHEAFIKSRARLRAQGVFTVPESTRAMAQFLTELGLGELGRILLRYPVLARLLGTSIEQWQQNAATLCRRFAADRAELAERFPRICNAPLQSIRTGLSDRHRGGQRVCLLKFPDGSILYKPRSLAPEAAYSTLLARLAVTSDAKYQLRAPEVLLREEYGWEEHVAPKPCNDLNEVALYYRKAGMQLFLMYLYGGTDFHQENVIAHGADPILIDLEGFCAPQLCPTAIRGSGAERMLHEDFYLESVFRTGLLPLRTLDEQGVLADLGGFGTPTAAQAIQKELWAQANRDGMARETVRTLRPRAGNAVLCGEEVMCSESWVASLQEGFLDLAQWFLTADGQTFFQWSLDELRDLETRFIFRDTDTFAKLLHGMLRPRQQRSGAALSLWLEQLARPLAAVDGPRPQFWEILDSEESQLLQFDVPSFLAKASSTIVHGADGSSIQGLVREPAVTTIERRYRSLTSAALRTQQRLIEASYYLQPTHRDAPTAAETRLETKRLTAEEATRAALEIAELLLDCSITGADGSRTWLAPKTTPSGLSHIRPMGQALYDGLLGPALFFAALSRSTGDEELRLAAESCLTALTRSDFVERSIRSVSEDGLGAGTGLGSTIYTLTVLSDITEDPRYRKHAAALYHALSEQQHFELAQTDVLNGAAGLLLACNALRRCEPDLPVGTIQTCAYYLQAHLESALKCAQRKNDTGDYLRTGAAHGLAGIAAALHGAAEVLQDDSLLATVQRAVACENSVFSDARQNWAASLKQAKNFEPAYYRRWCAGSPGIALTRLGLLHGPLDTFARVDIERALPALLDATLLEIDSLCCGNAGLADIALTLGSHLGNERLVDTAAQLLGGMLARYQASGTFAGCSPAGTIDPGFFQGLSGIGYALTRFAAMGKLPDVLSFQL
ncbi:MAG: type 2 lantipeptide synthetase LanM [Bdellovibrionales bacterium]|nr:type 2 lantipeptide synthetase LanM [Bdellovibrionales bacterium]